VSCTRWGLLLIGLLLAGCGTARSGLADCPNWRAAVRGAQVIAGCDARLHGAPESKCQAALRRCQGGCDICRFLGGDGLDAYVADEDEWAPIERVAMSKDSPNGYDGIRAKQDPGLFRRRYKFNWHLCHQVSFVDVLARTIAHEAMHECVAVNPPGIFDKRFSPPPGCSAEELENICVGR
jgi:hypothetical protein